MNQRFFSQEKREWLNNLQKGDVVDVLHRDRKYRHVVSHASDNWIYLKYHHNKTGKIMRPTYSRRSGRIAGFKNDSCGKLQIPKNYIAVITDSTT